MVMKVCLHLQGMKKELIDRAEVVKLLVEVLPKEFLVCKNERGNTALHWAALKCALFLSLVGIP